MIVEKNILTSLEFDKISQLAQAYCIGAPARLYFDNIRFFTDIDRLELILTRVQEMKNSFLSDDILIINHYEDITQILKDLKIKAFVLPVEALQQINNIIKGVLHIKDYFKDGKDFGINIEYVYEDKRMGTAGALSLVKERPKEPFFVMNGDLLTTVNFAYMLEYHLENRAVATMGVREYEYQVPFGVVNTIGNEIFSIEEKPKQKFFVSAGIYVLNPEMIDYIPKNEYYDMPSLFEKLIQEKKNTITFPIKEYWYDIGRIEEFKKVNKDYKRIFSE